VVSLDDGDMDELASGDSGIGWELVVCGIDVGCVAEVVGVLGERLWVSEDRRVRLEVVRPHPHGLEGAAQGVRGRTRVCRDSDEGVNET
jgi:hypothetical protein